jgi:hypothetical protein
MCKVEENEWVDENEGWEKREKKNKRGEPSSAGMLPAVNKGAFVSPVQWIDLRLVKSYEIKGQVTFFRLWL